jgi:hypothetical protein
MERDWPTADKAKFTSAEHYTRFDSGGAGISRR